MRTISVSVLKEDYDAFRRSARRRKLPIAHLIREAMAFYRSEKLEAKPRLTDLPVLVGHRPLTPLPERAEVYEEIYGRDSAAPTP